MSNQIETQWFTEVCEKQGAALQLKVKDKVCCVQSAYQTIEIYDSVAWGHIMVIDGFLMLTQKDNYLYHEMMTHPVLFTHRKPRQVVIIGGGDCGVLQQVLRHDSVERVQQIDIDEQVTILSQKYFPELCTNNADPRAQLRFGDGIEWVKSADPGSVDALIVDSTDPIGPAEGLFGVDFYRSCRRALHEEGVLIHQSESPLTHFNSIICPMHQAMRQAGFLQTQTLFFPQPTYPSGWWSATLASSCSLPLTEFRIEDVLQRNFSTLYYNEAIHLGALAIPEGLKARLASLSEL